MVTVAQATILAKSLSGGETKKRGEESTNGTESKTLSTRGEMDSLESQKEFIVAFSGVNRANPVLTFL